MNKKLIIITGVVSLVGFAGMFAFAWLTKTTPQAQSPEAEQTTPAHQEGTLLFRAVVTMASGMCLWAMNR